MEKARIVEMDRVGESEETKLLIQSDESGRHLTLRSLPFTYALKSAFTSKRVPNSLYLTAQILKAAKIKLISLEIDLAEPGVLRGVLRFRTESEGVEMPMRPSDGAILIACMHECEIFVEAKAFDD